MGVKGNITTEEVNKTQGQTMGEKGGGATLSGENLGGRKEGRGTPIHVF